jgi:hypothetical protein
MAFLRMSGLALAAVLGLSLPIGQATAMPANGLAVAVNQVPKRVEDVRLVCGPYRCWSTGWGWHRPFAYWGWRRPLYAYADPVGAGADHSTPMPDQVGAGVDHFTHMPDQVGAGVDHFTLTPDLAGAGADHFTHTPDQVGAGVDRFTLTPDPVGAGVDRFTLTPDPVGVGAGHSTHLPDPVGVGVGRSMPMPEDPIGAGVDHFTQPQSRPVSASIPGTAVGIPDTPGQPVLRLCGHEYLARMGHVEHVVVSHPCDVRHHQTNSVKTT